MAFRYSAGSTMLSSTASASLFISIQSPPGVPVGAKDRVHAIERIFETTLRKPNLPVQGNCNLAVRRQAASRLVAEASCRCYCCTWACQFGPSGPLNCATLDSPAVSPEWWKARDVSYIKRRTRPRSPLSGTLPG